MTGAVTDERTSLLSRLQSEPPTLCEDPLLLFTSFLTKARTEWMRLAYPFAGFGRQVSIHYSCDIRRSASRRIHIGDSVYIAPGTWLNVPESTIGAVPAIILKNGCKIG